MWQATIQCAECDDAHLIYCEDEAIPRVYSYSCPALGERVNVRFRDPSRILSPWEFAQARSPEAIEVASISARGAFEA